MRATRVALGFWLVAAVGACGDNGKQQLQPDAGPDAPSGPQCSDGVDNDGDGLVDFPADPGCVAPQQDSENDDCPNGPACPECANGVDDDGNGSVDFPNDPGCTSASDTEEFVNNPVACGDTLMIKPLPASNMATGTLDATSTSTLVPSCGSVTGAQAIAYLVHLSDPRVVVASTEGSAVDTVLSVRSVVCSADDAELACNDNATTGTASKVTVSLPAGNYYFIVQGKSLTTTGAYTLTIQTFGGEGTICTDISECGPGLVCRVPMGQTDMICTKPMCSDTVDDDGDGKNDYPDDPGCTAPSDNDETDDCPSGASCPVCANGLDDDGDGQTDYPTDTSCPSASGSSESCSGEQDAVDPITAGTTNGTLVGAHDDHDPSCVTPMGVDVLYTLKLPAMRSVIIDTEGTPTDTVLSLLNQTCGEPSLRCDDEGGTAFGASRIALTNFPAGNYIVAVDGYTTTSVGTFPLHVSGVISPGGSCEPSVTLGGALACPSTNPCIGAPGSMICEPSACGDGMDNDNDGLTDFPADPGCASLDDLDEADTCPGVGPGCPECADGVDNDGDGQIDAADPNCTTPSQSSEGCPTTDGVTQLVDKVTTGTTVGANNDTKQACGSTSTTAAAPDTTYQLVLPAMRQLNISNSSSFDAVTALYGSTCSGTALACSDPGTIALQNLAGGNYFLVVDGYSSGSGTYTLTTTGIIQNGASCESALAQSGAITCAGGFACKGIVGSRTCQPSACGDGLDNDGDFIADYPNDPGCSSINDDDESDSCPGGAGCPQCSNGLDDDGDGVIDYPDDPGCISASGTIEACFSTEGVIPLTMPSTPDTTVGATNDASPSCGSSSNTAPDKIYSLTVPALATLTITNANSFNAAVALFDSTCGGTPLACSDEPETITRTNVAAGTYFYLVDGFSTASGAYTIGLSGTIASGDSCEHVLVDTGVLTCAPGSVCRGTTGARTCQPTACADGMDNDGDGLTDFPAEPGCTSPSDDDETDTCPAGAGCPQCSNGMDDDGDTLIDYPADTGCSSAAGNLELRVCTADADFAGAISAPSTMGTLAGLADNFEESCQSNTGNDTTFALQLPVPVATLTIDTEGSTISDTVLSLKDASCTTEVLCNDDGGSGLLSLINATNVAAGTYSINVDGYSTSNNGAFTLNVHGTVVAGTDCTSSLFTAGVLTCTTGTTCTAGTCQ